MTVRYPATNEGDSAMTDPTKRGPSRRTIMGAAAAALMPLPLIPTAASAQGKALTITTTGILNNVNPYAHSSIHLYYIWSQIYGSLGRYNYAAKAYEGVLAESWETVEPTRWRFKLRSDLKRHDGGPGPTSTDVVHSWRRILSDPASQQAFFLTEVDKFERVDDRTFDIVTKRPVAQLLSLLFDRFMVTSADLHEKHGANADKAAAFGWGPYKLDRFDIDRSVIVARNPSWPGMPASAPETVIYRQILEAEQRVTALLNNEAQIARLIPPQLVDRLKSNPAVKEVETGSLEWMFLGMNVKIKPFDDPRVRRAVAHAINADLIVKRLLFGLADPMQGAIGKHQDCFAPSAARPEYDPKKAKALLAEAGFPDGFDVEFATANGRYVSDRQVGEALAQMLRQVGIRAKLNTPDYANFTNDIRQGKLPLYYTGRSAANDQLEALAQYFETGGSRRTNYSDPEADRLFREVRAAFDTNVQCDLQRSLSDKLSQDSPVVFLWTHRLVNGVRSNINWPADATGEPWLTDITVS